MIRLISILLCDDIREEANGKRILIGVYANELIASTRPAALSAKIHTVFELDGEACELEFETIVGDRKGSSKAEISSAYKQAMLQANIPLFFDAPTELTFRWRERKGKWSEPFRWQLKFAEDATELPREVVDEMRKDFGLVESE